MYTPLTIGSLWRRKVALSMFDSLPIKLPEHSSVVTLCRLDLVPGEDAYNSSCRPPPSPVPKHHSARLTATAFSEQIPSKMQAERSDSICMRIPFNQKRPSAEPRVATGCDRTTRNFCGGVVSARRHHDKVYDVCSRRSQLSGRDTAGKYTSA